MHLIIGNDRGFYNVVAEDPNDHGINAVEVEYEFAQQSHAWPNGADRPSVACISEIEPHHYREFVSDSECRNAGFVPLDGTHHVYSTFDEYARHNKT